MAHTMSDPERNKLLLDRIPVYQRTDADTTQMFQGAQTMYPPRKKLCCEAQPAPVLPNEEIERLTRAFLVAYAARKRREWN